MLCPMKRQPEMILLAACVLLLCAASCKRPPRPSPTSANKGVQQKPAVVEKLDITAPAFDDPAPGPLGKSGKVVHLVYSSNNVGEVDPCG